MPKKAARKSAATSDDEGSSGAAPPTKRVKKRVRGKQGALKVVMTMPVDIIWEICTHLDVADLYALSNTSKTYRAVVTGPSSAGLFKLARERSEMPELLDPMSDLAYAALMFGKGCQFCGKKGAGKVDPSFRARICNNCLKDVFVSDQTPEGRVFLDKLNRYTTFLANRTLPHGRTVCYYHPAELKRLSKEIDKKFPYTAKTRESGPLFILRSLGGDSDDDDFDDGDDLSVEDRTEMNADWSFVISKSPRFGFPPPNSDKVPTNEFQKWFEQRIEARKLRDQDTNALKTWMRRMEIRKSQANQNIRSGRRDDIERRLEAIGFEKSEFRAHSFLSHTLVKSTRPLSDRTYSTNVEPVLKTVLDHERRKNLASGVENVYSTLRQDHPDKDYFPLHHIFFQLPSISPILEDISKNPPKARDMVLPDDVKASALEDILKLIRSRREELLRAIVSSYMGLRADLEKKERKLKEKGKDSGKKKKEKQFIPTEYHRISDLPLTLPRLPPWIPRSKDSPILASDEQLAAFLETSPLAQFECVKCSKLLDTKSLFKHLSSSYNCQYYNSGGLEDGSERKIEVKISEWMRVEGKKKVERPLVRINKEVLGLVLKLQQLVESTPLVVSPDKQLPDLGDCQDLLGEEKPNWYEVKLACERCPTLNSGYSYGYNTSSPVTKFYAHLKEEGVEQHEDQDSDSVKVKTVVNYSMTYRSKHREIEREQSRARHYGMEEDSDSMGFVGYGYGAEGMYYSDMDSMDGDDRSDECTIM